MINFYFVSHCTIHNLLSLPLLITRLYLSFYVDRSIWRELKLGINTGNGRLLVWESYIAINIADPYIETHTSRKVRRFGIMEIHSDHYVRLAGWLSNRLPWLAEYRWADTDGYMNYYVGRIKPFGPLCMAARIPTQKLEHYQ